MDGDLAGKYPFLLDRDVSIAALSQQIEGKIETVQSLFGLRLTLDIHHELFGRGKPRPVKNIGCELRSDLFDHLLTQRKQPAVGIL